MSPSRNTLQRGRRRVKGSGGEGRREEGERRGVEERGEKGRRGEERGREGRRGEGRERRKAKVLLSLFLMYVCMYSTTNLPTEEQLQNSPEICQHLT